MIRVLLERVIKSSFLKFSLQYPNNLMLIEFSFGLGNTTWWQSTVQWITSRQNLTTPRTESSPNCRFTCFYIMRVWAYKAMTVSLCTPWSRPSAVFLLLQVPNWITMLWESWDPGLVLISSQCIQSSISLLTQMSRQEKQKDRCSDVTTPSFSHVNILSCLHHQSFQLLKPD